MWGGLEWISLVSWSLSTEPLIMGSSSSRIVEPVSVSLPSQSSSVVFQNSDPTSKQVIWAGDKKVTIDLQAVSLWSGLSRRQKWRYQLFAA